MEPGVRRDLAIPVTGARVALLDGDLLANDFPSLQPASLALRHPELRRLDGEERRRRVGELRAAWLLERAALVSVTQAAQSRVNTAIPVAGRLRVVHRPPRYGRAFLVDTGDAHEPGLLDVKGVGIDPGRRPGPALHQSGLLPLGEALEELVMQLLVEAIFRHSGSGFRTLPVYAVLDLGFDVRLAGGARVPAGALVRRAHRRNRGGGELPARGSREQEAYQQIEMLLRLYGVTSVASGGFLELAAAGRPAAVDFGGREWPLYSRELIGVARRLVGERGHRRFEMPNIQATRGARPGTACLLDFGHFEVRERFEHPILSPVANRPLRWGGVCWPDDPNFPQPDPRWAVTVGEWGLAALPAGEAEELGYEPSERPMRHGVLARRLARDLRSGRLAPAAVAAGLAEQVESTVRRWRRAPAARARSA